MELHFADAGELDGVADEVDEDLSEFAFVAVDAERGFGGEFEAEGEALLGAEGAEGGLDAGCELAEVEIGGVMFHAAGLDFGEVEDFIDETEDVLAAGLDAESGVELVGGEGGVSAHELGVAEDGVERGADFMTHAGQEIGFGFVGGGGGGFGALADGDFLLESSIGAADIVGATGGVDEVGAGGEREEEADDEEEGRAAAGAGGGETLGRGKDDGPASAGDFEPGGGAAAQRGSWRWGEREEAFAFGGMVEEFRAKTCGFKIAEGFAHEDVDAEDGDGKAGEFLSSFGRVRGNGAVEDGEEDEEAGGVSGALGELDGGGGDGQAGVAGLFEGSAAAGVGSEVVAEGGLVGEGRFDEVDGDVFGSGLGGLEPAAGVGFAEGEAEETVFAGGGLEGIALGVGDEGVPGERLEFGLAFEGGLDEVAEALAVEVSVGRVEGIDGVEDLHGTEDGDVETFDLLVGEVGSGVGGVLLFAVTEIEEEGG